MRTSKDLEKCCGNCGRYVRHYFFDVKSLRFREVECGHCFDLRRKPRSVCEQWEAAPSVPSVARRVVADILEDLVKKISEMEMFLSE